MNDPSDGVHPPMLKHIHLVSSYTFPSSANLQLDTVVDRLLAAPNIVTNVKSMVWMFVETPRDGMSMLVWQPLAKLGIEFASDGYIWADPEQAFSSQAKGYTVEMYWHKCGFRIGEPVATHQRRRYRLTPGHNPNPNAPPPDPALWIVHYSQTDPTQHIPSNQIPLSGYMHSTLTSRKFLQQQGQLVRKEFMLHDRSSWPTINLPGSNAGAQASAYPNNVISHFSRQQPGYVQPRAVAPNLADTGPPPAKRVRHQRNAPDAGVAALQAPADNEPTIYDEEDVSRGDALDFLTPRDISAMRYKQHHNWLGEVFRSPYDTQQIVPGELGLGRKGELEILTKEFFNAHTEVSSLTAKGVPPPRVGRMEAGKADEFTQMAGDRMAELHAEMERMKRKHARRMAKLAKGSELRNAERALRTVSVNTGAVRTDDRLVHGSSDHGESKISAIEENAEAIVGKKIREIKEVECIQKGGLQEKVNDSENVSPEYDFGDQAGDLSGQIPAFQTPQDQLSSMEHTPGLVAERAVALEEAPEADKGDQTVEGLDVAMGGMQDTPQAGEGEPEDWVVVSKDGDDTKGAANEELPELDTFANDPAIGSDVGSPGENLGTTAEALVDFSAAAENELDADFATNDFGEGVDFGSLDTAGEALAGYADEENAEMGDNADLGLDDSAFDDAFHNETDVRRENDESGP
ncbi:MAG: hypothetical protein Q9216_001061 [Gyalolechia sp. 2 TL-2023]